MQNFQSNVCTTRVVQNGEHFEDISNEIDNVIKRPEDAKKVVSIWFENKTHFNESIQTNSANLMEMVNNKGAIRALQVNQTNATFSLPDKK